MLLNNAIFSCSLFCTCPDSTMAGAQCCVFGQDMLLSHCLSPANALDNPAMEQHPIQGD